MLGTVVLSKGKPRYSFIYDPSSGITYTHISAGSHLVIGRRKQGGAELGLRPLILERSRSVVAPAIERWIYDMEDLL